MTDLDLPPTNAPTGGAADETRIPIVAEEASVTKRVVGLEHVSIHTSSEEERVVVRDLVRRDQVEVVRVAIEREVTEAPAVRTEGEVTIVSVLEERLVVEKRLFVVEELHLRRHSTTEPVELATTLRRTRVDVAREKLHQQEE